MLLFFQRMANVTEEVTFEVKHAPMRYGGIVGLPSGELGVLVYAQPPGRSLKFSMMYGKCSAVMFSCIGYVV
jgi:hypothetical protein